MNKISTQDRSALIRLASQMPVGSDARRAILVGLQKVSMEHASEEAREKYLKEHQGADPKNHTVKGDKDKGGGGDAKPPGKVDRPSEKDFDAAWDAVDEAGASSKLKGRIQHLGEGGFLGADTLAMVSDGLSKTLDGLEGDGKKVVEGILQFVKAEKKKMDFISSVADDMGDALGGFSEKTLKALAKNHKLSAFDLDELIEEGNSKSKSWGPDEKKAWEAVKAHAEARRKYERDQE